MAVRNIEREIEELVSLRNAPAGEERERKLQKALKDKVNLIAAKAAALTAEFELRELVPDLCVAFERMMRDPVKTDPQCWGKNAIAQALKDLGHNEADVFLKGAQHVQYEPVWAGEEDSAANLRATCSIALLACADLTREDKLWHMVPLLTERSASLRKDAANALEALGGREAALLLRMKARMGDEDPTVTGQVFESLLRVERETAVRFVTEFLRSMNPEVRDEAALALGASRLTAAIAALKAACEDTHLHLNSEIAFRALSISRHEHAIEYLLDKVRHGRVRDAQDALDALMLHRDSTDIRKKIAEAAEHRMEPEIRRVFETLTQC